MMFDNPFEPTELELRDWAKNSEACYPDEISQDWDLVITSFETAPTLLKLANEESPNRKFFLRCLYLLAGDCVRNGVKQHKVNQLLSVLELMPMNAKSVIILWVKRTNELINTPSLFNYHEWCEGQLAYKEVDEAD